MSITPSLRSPGLAVLTFALALPGCTESGRDFTPDVVDTTAPADTSVAETSSDTTAELPEEVEVTPSSPGCVVAESLFTPYCVRCHSQNDNFPNLNAGALEHMVGVEALAYPGKTLVVAGDPAASFLYRKVVGPAADEGVQMPPAEEALDVPPEAVAALEAWIAAGAPACEGHTDPGPMTVTPPTPDAAVTFTQAPSGFQTTHPSWAEVGTCTSAQWWRYEDDEPDSERMHPGRACIDCHTESRDGPSFSYAGTVYAAANDTDDCRGVGGVTVEILDAEDVVLGTALSNNAGNFSIETRDLRFRPFRAKLSYQGREREMQLMQSSTGDCNTCHDSQGNNGALGRIVAP